MSSFTKQLLLIGALVCSVSWPTFSVDAQQTTSAKTALARAALPKGEVRDFGPRPKIIDAPLSSQSARALNTMIDGLSSGNWDKKQEKALDVILDTGDARFAWIISDMLRFATNRNLAGELSIGAEELLDSSIFGFDSWHRLTERLIAWDVPAPPNYLHYKRQIFIEVVPEWEPLFEEGDIDWRLVTWGGVRIDDRAYDKTDKRCNCIPAADNPKVISAKKAKWIDDDALVFGIGLNGEYRAYPRQIMEVREMVNDTLGGRDLGIPYCTLCGAAQAWFTDDVPDGVERPILRTSGLLTRSNKVMYDLNTKSVFDTFRGNAVTGPLAEKGVQLKQASVITTTWGEWKKAHPETTVLIESLSLGRNFDFRNGRDADGPIFPIGDADPRLAVQEDVLGVTAASGQKWAFHINSLIAALNAGETVSVENIQIVLDAGGVKAVDENGNSLGTHQAFWFAWSQFYPDTKLWPE